MAALLKFLCEKRASERPIDQISSSISWISVV